jgi:hypothetical protein
MLLIDKSPNQFVPVAIDLIVQHIRDFLNNRVKVDELSVPPSPSPSPVHGPRRLNTADGHFTRPH